MFPRKGFRCASGDAKDDQSGPIPEGMAVDRGFRVGDDDEAEIRAIGEGPLSDETGLIGKNDILERAARESFFFDRCQVIRQEEIRFDIDQHRAGIKRDFVVVIVIFRDAIIDHRRIFRDCAQHIAGQDVDEGDPVAITDDVG